MTVRHNGSTVSVACDSRIAPFGAELRHYKLDGLRLWDDFLIGNMSFVGSRRDAPYYVDILVGDERDVIKFRSGITGPAILKYRFEYEMIESMSTESSKWGIRVIEDAVEGLGSRFNALLLRLFLDAGGIEAIFIIGMCLPNDPYLSDDDVKYIVKTIKHAIE